jgi:hypothetical protein
MSTMPYRKPYPPELRREAVELVRLSGQSMRAIARDLDVSGGWGCFYECQAAIAVRSSTR